MNWKPITFTELSDEILNGEKQMNPKHFTFWNEIKINPKKWSEDEYGNEGNGFWVVAKFKNLVVYYNDIEDGFNISDFKEEGKIENYCAEQDELNIAILKLSKLLP